jgi:hypothetical protein
MYFIKEGGVKIEGKKTICAFAMRNNGSVLGRL